VPFVFVFFLFFSIGVSLKKSSETGQVMEQKHTADVPAEQGGDDAHAGRDFYQIAHSVTEKVSKQSSFLVGGKLKDYQVKGLGPPFAEFIIRGSLVTIFSLCRTGMDDFTVQQQPQWNSG